MKRKSVMFFIDVCIFAVVYWFSILIFPYSVTMGYLDDLPTGDYIHYFILLFVVMFALRFIARVYTTIWRYADASTYLRLIISDLCSGLVIFAYGRIFNQLGIGFVLTLCLILLTDVSTIASRFAYQIIYALRNAAAFVSVGEPRVRTAIVGAGNIGAALAEEFTRNPQALCRPVCFIDIDSSKIGQRLNGLPVLREDDTVLEKLHKLEVREIIIALPDLGAGEREHICNFYEKSGCRVKLYDYPSDPRFKGRLQLRDMRIEDLLPRSCIKIDNTLSRNYYRDKTVLVTGGGGSIGSELCRQIAALHPKKLVIFDIYENNAYDIQQELIANYGSDFDLDVLIGSVRDVARLDEVFSAVRPQVVLHAAAHKHVPLMEHSSAEAIKNNIIGTYNTANAAEKYDVQKFVLISTDKAVNPTNIMGASKRLCEMVIQCRTNSKTQFVAVRFGNVLGSNGSVIPLFKKQIAAGGPITITDRNIIRYFMTIPEAAQLVLLCGAMANKGDLYVMDMGKPVKIYDLAEKMIRLSGLVPGEDIAIKEIGLRPGEKLYEELLMKNENLDKTENEMIFIERDKPYTRDQVEDKLSVLRAAMKDGSNAAVKRAIKQTVPTFHEPYEVNTAADTAKFDTCQYDTDELDDKESAAESE